jgi:hypothetical protein
MVNKTGQENSTVSLVLNESSIYNILVVDLFIFIYTTGVAEDSNLVEYPSLRIVST